MYWYLAAMGLVFLINLVPAFMPASWMVLTFFRIKYGLPLFALSIGGALCSAAGRLLLARGSRLLSQRIVPGSDADLRELGAFLEDHRQHVGVATFLYTLTPLPSNNLFIAAGMVQIGLVWVVAGFIGGRLIADSLWVWLAETAFNSLEDIFADVFTSWVGILLQLTSLTSIALLFRLPWARWVRRRFQNSDADGV
jgi:hypothetical protein